MLSTEPIRGLELGLGQDTLPVRGRDELMSGYCHLIGHKGSIQVSYWLFYVIQIINLDLIPFTACHYLFIVLFKINECVRMNMLYLV